MSGTSSLGGFLTRQVSRASARKKNLLVSKKIYLKYKTQVHFEVTLMDDSELLALTLFLLPPNFQQTGQVR